MKDVKAAIIRTSQVNVFHLQQLKQVLNISLRVDTQLFRNPWCVYLKLG